MSPIELLLSARVGTDLLLALFVKGPLILAIAWGGVRFFCQSASTRHALWTVAIFAVGILPAVEVFTPGWVPPSAVVIHYPAETAWVGIEAIEAYAPDSSRQGSGTRLPAASLFLLTWWLGVVTLGTKFGTDVVRVAILRRRSTPVDRDSPQAVMLDRERRRLGIRRRVTLAIVDEEGLAATAGWASPLIVLGSDVMELPSGALRSILVHELAHVDRHDTLTHALARLAVITAWPNPIVWWARSRQAEARERACDDRVLRQGIEAPAYARLLLDFATMGAGLRPVLRTSVGLRLSPTKHRLEAILDPDQGRTPIRAWATASLGAAFLGSALTLGSLNLASSHPGTGSTPELVSALSHPDATVRASAARTLSRREPTEAREELERLLDDPSRDVRLSAMSALEQLADPRSLPAFGRVLERPFDEGRGEHGFVLKLAMRAVGEIGTREAVALLDAQLERPVPELRWLALDTRLGIDPSAPEARRHLQWMAEHDPSPRNRAFAQRRLTN